MPSTANNISLAPGLSSFLKSLKGTSVESSIERLISCALPLPLPIHLLLTSAHHSLLKRRQIRNSRPCAYATVHLLLRIVAECRACSAQDLLTRIRHVGHRLITAQPREMVVGNIVRRVLGLIREVSEGEENDVDSSTAVTPRSMQLIPTTTFEDQVSPRTSQPLAPCAMEPLNQQTRACPHSAFHPDGDHRTTLLQAKITS